MGTSSANPDKLVTYSSDGLALIETLRTQSNGLTDAVEALRSSSSSHVPDLGSEHSILADVVGDWQHLDEFVGDVGLGFRAADSGAGVVTVSDADILRLGQVGFADRDEAEAAALDAQQRLDELLHQRPEDIDQAELDALLNDIARGQYDTAFAVTFSEAVGVEGYVNTMALIRNNYTSTDGGWHVTDEGMAYVAMLGTTLTTALHTHDYDATPDLAPGDRLSFDFVDDLTSGYHGADHAGQEHVDPDNPMYLLASEEAISLDRDLSVLLSYTEPPTWMAVDIANNRLSPLLNDYMADVPGSGSYGGSDVMIWGDRSGIITNYATMLGNDSDASTLWLYDTANGAENGNLELVIERAGGANLDDGEALARVVENGLTNANVHESIPGAPSYVEGGLMREALMERAIDYVGEHDEINNDYLHGAFATGVDSNMNVIDERINAPFGEDGRDRGEILEAYGNTHDFLRETMGNPQAAVDILQTVQDYGFEQARSLTPDDPTTQNNELEARLRELGRIQGLTTEAMTNASVGAAVDEILGGSVLGPTPGSATNYAVSWIPYAGKVNDALAGAGIGAGNFLDWGLGEVVPSDYETLSEAERRGSLQRASDRMNRALWLSAGLYESDTPEGADIRASAQGQPFVNPDGSLKTSMTPEEAEAYRNWAMDAVGNDDNQGPLYTAHGDMGTGYNDVHEGDTDVRNRR